MLQQYEGDGEDDIMMNMGNEDSNDHIDRDRLIEYQDNHINNKI